jgi:hypothetical protein
VTRPKRPYGFVGSSLNFSLPPVPLPKNLIFSAFPEPHSIQLYIDNQGAIKLAKNPIFHARSKHIEIHYDFITKRVLEGEITLHYINTNAQPVDALTKPLGKTKFVTHRNSLGLHSLKYLRQT